MRVAYNKDLIVTVWLPMESVKPWHRCHGLSSTKLMARLPSTHSSRWHAPEIMFLLVIIGSFRQSSMWKRRVAMTEQHSEMNSVAGLGIAIFHEEEVRIGSRLPSHIVCLGSDEFKKFSHVVDVVDKPFVHYTSTVSTGPCKKASFSAQAI